MTVPAVDLDYDLEEDSEIVFNRTRLHLFFMRRMEEAVVEATVRGEAGRFLDVGCGMALQAARLAGMGWQSWGLEPSLPMLSLARKQVDGAGVSVMLVRGIAEALPFRSATFDGLLCKGSIDHFVDPGAFIAEVARVLRPEGRAVIAMTNYGGLTCRLARALARAKRALGLPTPEGRFRYWEPPPTHTFEGDYRFVGALGGSRLEIERCFGVSLLWPLPRWAWLVDRLPYPLARSALRAADGIAYRFPALADVIVSTWRLRQR